MTAFIVTPLPLATTSSAHPGVTERAVSRCRLTILRQHVPERAGALSKLRSSAAAATDESLVNFDHIQGALFVSFLCSSLSITFEARRRRCARCAAQLPLR